MAYSYSYPYMGNPVNPYNGMNGGYQPMSNIGSQNQPALNPYYQMQQYPINNQRFSAFFVNDYSEVKNAVVSSDGSPSLFMMNDKDVFYIKKVGEDGRTILKSYSFTEYIDTAETQTNSLNSNTTTEKQSHQNNDYEKEINGLKEEVNGIKNSLNGLINSLNATFGQKESANNTKKEGEVNATNVQKFTTNDF